MPAQSAPLVVGYNQESRVITFSDGRSANANTATKVELMAVAKHLGIRFVGKPTMHFPLEAIRSAILENRRVVNYADCQQYATPKVSPAVPSSRPVVAAVTPSVSTAGVESAIADVVRQALAALPTGGVDMERFAELERSLNAVNVIANSAVAGVATVGEAVGVANERTNRLHGLLEQMGDKVAAQIGELSTKVDSLRPVQIVLPNKPVVTLKGVQHKQFETVLRILSKNRNVFMVGSAGTGKTTIAERAAQALGLEFSAQSFNAQSSKADLVGFQTANGVYVGTEFRKRFENGGVYLMDEIDNANPNILGTLNAALANGYMAFPDGMVKRHDGFVAIAAGNTYGNGATAQYVGRNPIDAATKDRFVFVDILIDENVEDAMVQATGLDTETAMAWLTIVRQCRKNVNDHGLQLIVSPRAAENGAHLIDAGFSTREVVDMTILKGAKPEVADKVLAGVGL